MGRPKRANSEAANEFHRRRAHTRALKFSTFLFIGLAVYRLSLFADDPRLLKKLKKIHESFASAAFASIWIAAALVSLNVYFENSLLFRAALWIFAASGLTCVLSQLHSRPQFIFPLPKPKSPGDHPPKL
jgi:hypothetical protein